MNIHPIFVHFPIGLLTIYALLELIQWKKLTTHRSWFDIKAALVVIGTILGLATLQTGEMAEEAIGQSSLHDLIEMHSLFANVTMWIFGLIAASYIVIFLTRTQLNLVQKNWWRALVRLFEFIQRSYVLVPLAFIGLITLTITGALGGSIVYGPDVDPVVNFIYHLFFTQ